MMECWWGDSKRSAQLIKPQQRGKGAWLGCKDVGSLQKKKKKKKKARQADEREEHMSGYSWGSIEAPPEGFRLKLVSAFEGVGRQREEIVPYNMYRQCTLLRQKRLRRFLWEKHTKSILTVSQLPVMDALGRTYLVSCGFRSLAFTLD